MAHDPRPGDQSPHDRLEPDPRLQAALRHAPDHDLAPPPELSAGILRAARAAVHAPAAARRGLWQTLGHHLADFWRRPTAATGFAGVLIASLAGMLWWSEEPPAPSPMPVPMSTPAPAAKPPAAVPGSDSNAAQADRAEAGPQAPPPADAELRPSPTTEPAVRAAAPAAAAQESRRSAPSRQRSSEGVAGSGAGAGSGANAGVSADASAKTGASADASASADPRASASASADASAGRNAADVKAATEALPPTLSRLARTPLAATSAWAGLRWQSTASAAAAPAAENAQAWLARLRQFTDGQWKAAAPPAVTQLTAPAAAASAGADHDTVRWLHGDALAATVLIANDHAVWIEPDGRTWTAPLPPGARDQLRVR